MTIVKRLLTKCSCLALVCSWALSVHAQNGPWKINLKNVEIAHLIEEVATITGKTFVVDPRVKGTVSIVSDTELDRKGVYDVLLSALKVQEFSVIESGDVVEIVQSSRARTLGGTKLDPADAAHDDMWVTHVFDAGHLDPNEVVKSLRQLAPQHAQFSAVKESNAVLITDRKQNMDALIRVFETLQSAAEIKTVVVNLDHAATSDVIELLENLLDTDAPVKVIENERSNSLVLRGTEFNVMDALQVIDLIDQPSNEVSNTRVFRLGQSKAADVALIVQEILVKPADGTSQSSANVNNVRLTADESMNAVVVNANPAFMKRIEVLIKELDRRRNQVLIEAAMVEINLTEIGNYGVEFAAGDSEGDSIPVISTSLNGVLSTLLGQLNQEADFGGSVSATDILGLLDTPTIAISQLDPDGLSFGAIINALNKNTYADLLSTPSVVAMNNTESHILVGQNVPFRSGNLVFPNDQSISGLRPTSREDIGTELTVTPSIHEDLSVRMEIQASIEAIQEGGIGIGDSGLADVATNKRELTTVVVAENRQTIVLGGLIRNENRANANRVPVLGSIPIMGRLFRSESETEVRTMLLIFIRPTVINDASDAQAVTDRKFGELRELTIGGDADVQSNTDELFKGNLN